MLKQFFPFYGSKLRIVRFYPRPLFQPIVELFAGAASYSHLYPHEPVILNDIDPNIYRTWDYLIRASEQEILGLPLLQPHQSVDDLRVPEEAKILIGWWCNRGSSQPKKSITKFSARWGDRYAQTWGSKVKLRIVTQQKHIRHWSVFNLSYDKLASSSKLDKSKYKTWFIDPPYQRAGKHYRYHTINYPDLARICLDLKGKIIVCENEQADWLPFTRLLTARSNRSTGVEVNKNEMIFTRVNV